MSYCDVVMDDQGVASDLLSEAQALGVSIKAQTDVKAITESGNVELESGESNAFDTVINTTGTVGVSINQRLKPDLKL